MHPWTLHATTNLWSYRHARAELARTITVARKEPPDGLRSTTYGTRSATGGHSDRVLHLVTSDSELERLCRHAVRADHTLVWLAGHAAPGPGDPAARLTAAVPNLLAPTAEHIARWVAEADERLRRVLGMPPDRVPMPGVPCPACGCRRLQVCSAALDRTGWTVVCDAGCRCIGARCPCTTGVQGEHAAGVPHIWPWAAITSHRATTQEAAA